jgi:hypothetical protein
MGTTRRKAADKADATEDTVPGPGQWGGKYAEAAEQATPAPEPEPEDPAGSGS